MDATPSHRALLRHADVMRASMAARSRAISANWLLAMLMVGLAVAVWAGHLFAFSFVQQLPFPVMFAIGTYLPTIVPALFAFVVVVLVGSIQNWAVRRAYLSNFKRLDIPAEIDALFEIEAEGLLAVCIQHEMDHLQGKVFVEYLSPLKRNRIKSKMMKARRELEKERA